MNASAISFIHFYQNLFQINSSTPKQFKKINILILAPHPDDECLMAPAPLRLKLENQARVIAAAVTLGSHQDRQEERKQEFQEACHVLGFEPKILSANWDEKLGELIQLIETEEISLIVSPHLKDHHPTHIKTSELAQELIRKTKFNGLFFESEFWGELQNPNLLIEVTSEVFTLQFNALEKHVGEITRNPYHLRLASHLVDNVRKGAEKVAVLGSPSPEFAFGSLYQVNKVTDGKMNRLPSQILYSTSDLSLIS